MLVVRVATMAALAGLFVHPLPVAAESAEAGGFGARVTNGVIAQDRPSTGGLLAKSGINYQLICSGTLIGCQTFLTAAHCVCDGSPFSRCGTPDPSAYSVYLQDVGIVGVSAIHVDPVYEFGNQGDVAVLTLASPTTGVPPTPINTTMRVPYGTAVEIAGYGLTEGSAEDTGMLRRGLAETSVCTEASDATHVCWDFTSPMDAPGLDSNTCPGDSGGPLFADLGAGNSVVGITSGGTSADCLPTDHSYDTDVYVHRSYIQGIAGSDLLNTSCGSISQVGDAATARTTFDFDTFSRDEQACRKELSKQYTAYTLSALKAWQSCLTGVAKGSRSGPCPDAELDLDLAAALSTRIRLDKLAPRCPDPVVPNIGAGGLCVSAMTAADLAACIETAGNDAVAAALTSEYADDTPGAAIADDDQLDCQEAIAKATAGLFKSQLKLSTRCQVFLASGKVGSCPDLKTSSNISKAGEKAASRIEGVCTDAAVAALDAADSFGGSCAGVTSAHDLASCENADHAAVAADLVALLADQTMDTDLSFTVPAGAAELRVSLNGKDNGFDDLDLYLRAGATASETQYDVKSENGGMFEEAIVMSPAAGTWHVHLGRYSGPALIPYQLTATAFQP